MSGIPSYIVSRDDYYSFKKASTRIKDYSKLYVDYLEIPIKQLMQKYNLYNKSIISIGAGRGYEEYWFSQENKLTLLDDYSSPIIDNEEPILEYLSSLSSPKSKNDELRYIIEDAFKYNENEKFDVIYMSSFPPDEYYKKFKNFIRQLIPPIFIRNKILKYWKRKWVPFHPNIKYFITNYLKDNGLFIVQSHYTEIPGNYPNYVEALKDFFKENGMHLVRMYYYFYEPYKYLIISFKGTDIEFKNYLESIKNNKDITTFFGRHQVIRYLDDVHI